MKLIADRIRKGKSVNSAAWCTVDHNNLVFRAQVTHIGRGKFKILHDNQDDIHVGKLIDASDIFGCDVERRD